MDGKASDFLVACLCAAWCGTCRDYRPGFAELMARRPAVQSVWVDIEDESELAGDVDVENFPTLIIQRGNDVLFCGPMLPELRLLDRLIDTLMSQSPEESAAYARGTPERRSWQGLADIRSRLPAG